MEEKRKGLIICKTCGAEIAKNAKVCPKCGAKIKNWKKTLIILGIIVFIIVVGASGGDSDKPKKVGEISSSNSASTETKNTKSEFSVGETAELKGVSATLVSVTESSGSMFYKPASGNVFALCEFVIENNSSEEITVSSMLSFEAYCDDYVCNYSLGSITEDDVNQLDGTIAVGKKMNGVICYEVPSDWEELEIHFNPNVWSGNDFIFIANH